MKYHIFFNFGKHPKRMSTNTARGDPRGKGKAQGDPLDTSGTARQVTRTTGPTGLLRLHAQHDARHRKRTEAKHNIKYHIFFNLGKHLERISTNTMRGEITRQGKQEEDLLEISGYSEQHKWSIICSSTLESTWTG